MITLIRASHQVNYRTNEYVGKSTDIKPRKDTPGFNIQNGDILYCLVNFQQIKIYLRNTIYNKEEDKYVYYS